MPWKDESGGEPPARLVDLGAVAPEVTVAKTVDRHGIAQAAAEAEAQAVAAVTSKIKCAACRNGFGVDAAEAAAAQAAGNVPNFDRAASSFCCLQRFLRGQQQYRDCR